MLLVEEWTAVQRGRRLFLGRLTASLVAALAVTTLVAVLAVALAAILAIVLVVALAAVLAIVLPGGLSAGVQGDLLHVQVAVAARLIDQILLW